MQFLVYDPNYNPEGAPPPTPELMAEMGKFIGEATQAGALVTTGALQPKGTRLKLSGGKFTVTDGPFIELKELLAAGLSSGPSRWKKRLSGASASARLSVRASPKSCKCSGRMISVCNVFQDLTGVSYSAPVRSREKTNG
jgi:hypothetical protein